MTDKVNLITRVKDEWGTLIETVQENIAARVEYKNSIVRDQTGKEVTSNVHILLDPDAVVGYQTVIQITQLCGESVADYDKKWVIKSLAKGTSFVGLTWEIWL